MSSELEDEWPEDEELTELDDDFDDEDEFMELDDECPEDELDVTEATVDDDELTEDDEDACVSRTCSIVIVSVPLPLSATAVIFATSGSSPALVNHR
jgi:hypothetical protein